MDSPLFWFWWLLTLLVCLWPLLQVWDRPREALGFPVIASLMWLYFYVYLPYEAVTHLDASLHGLPVTFGQFLSCASFACLLAGWYLRVGRREPQPRPPASYHLGRLWVLGIAWLVIGNAGMYSFAAAGTTYQTSTGYWYMLYHVGYAGIALCVVTLALARRHVDPLSMVLFVALIGSLTLPSLIGSRRGPMFTAIIAAVYAFMLARKTIPRLSLTLGTLAFAGFVMLVLVEARAYTYRGQTWEDALENMTLEDVMAKRARRSMDNEFVNHCLQVHANLETGQYQYGTPLLSAFLNWIPRALWPDKPARNRGWFFEARDLYRSGPTNLTTGGAWGAVADSFNNFWYLFFFFWFVVGWFIASVYTRAQRGDDLSWKMYYLGILMSTHWFIAQCAAEAVVPCLMFEGVFWVSFRCCRTHLVPAGDNPTPREVPASLRSGVLALHGTGGAPVRWPLNGQAKGATAKP